MCKLFAYINNETKLIPAYVGTKLNKALRHLFYINSYGQVDGSGIMWMDSDGDTDFLKAPISSPVLMDFKSFDSIKADLYKNKFVAGHTRYSTVGSNTWENSHPFEFGNYMGIQNGTISNSHKGLVQGKISPCNVDSASVFWSFDQQGVANTLNRYEGEGVFMYFNKENKSFNVVKNNYRTLYKAKVDKLDTYILATDKFALEFVAERSGLLLESVEPVVNDKLITHHFNGATSKVDMEVPAPVRVYNDYYTSNYYRGYNNNNNNYKGKAVPNGNVKKPTTPAVVHGNLNSTNTTNLNSSKTAKVSTTEGVKSLPDPKTRNNSYYITDCDICLNPIHTDSLMFSDDPDPLKATFVACSCCEIQLKQFTGKEVYKITDTTGLAK